MPARAFPSVLNATPGVDADLFECAVAQVAVQFVRLGVVGHEEIEPAVPSMSSIATPSDFELVSNIPLVAVTSSKVPSPRLRNSQQVSPRYASGVQYDFCLPSLLQKTS